MKIALVARGFEWAGGVEFLRLICNGLATRLDGDADSIFLLLPVANRIESPMDFLRVAKQSLRASIRQRRLFLVSPKPRFDQSTLDYFSHIRSAKVEFVYHDDSAWGFKECLRRIGADVALPINGTLGPRFEVPWIGYIYDFQHRYHPSNFTATECYQREINFATTLKDADVVIVNSQAVRNDVQKFYPWADLDRVVALPFAPSAQPAWFDTLPDAALAKYGLPKNYLLISNQFWIHKDHPTAVRALSLLREHIDVALVCTGGLSDYRRAGYMGEIEELIRTLGLTATIQILGHIPKRDQIEIMKSAIAVVQPTLFEGGPGGGSAYDAISLGVPVVLSDIPVNREVVGKNVHFFASGQPSQLAARLRELIDASVVRPNRDALLKQGEESLSRLGDALQMAINRALRLH